MIDIIFFAAVAILIFIKLRSQFGRVDEDQKREAIKKFLREQANANQNAETAQNPELKELNPDFKKPQNLSEVEIKSLQILDKLDPELKENVALVLKESNTTAFEFVTGANKAFEMVIEAFCQGNKETLRLLLSDELYGKFSSAIDERVAANKTLNTSIISVDQAIIKDAKIANDQAEIKVNFVSKQIIYVEDANKEIVDGSKEKIQKVSDSWVFTRDINSVNPNWKINSTKS